MTDHAARPPGAAQSERDPKGVVRLDDEAGVERIVKDTLFGLWATVNNLSRLRPTRRERYRVTVFGSARTDPDHWVYREVKRMCTALGGLGCDIVTGGGPGLMRAANEGARAGSGQSIGVNIELPFEQEANPFVEQVFQHESFFTRLHQFVLMSDAYIVTPGGIGTVLEATLVWQLLQVRHLQDTPLIFVGGMWREFVEWARAHMLRPGFELVSAADLSLPQCVDDADQAVAIIREYHARWAAKQSGA